jgi:hypothetical protein
MLFGSENKSATAPEAGNAVPPAGLAGVVPLHLGRQGETPSSAESEAQLAGTRDACSGSLW